MPTVGLSPSSRRLGRLADAMTATIIPFPLERRTCGHQANSLRCDLPPHPDFPDVHRFRSPAETARLSAAADNLNRKRPTDRFTITKGPRS